MSKSKTQSFNDGKCDIYVEIDAYKNRTPLYENIRFADQELGYKRFFTAAANNVQANRLIRIPFVTGIDSYCIIVINDLNTYEIKMVQTILDTVPKCIELTLQQSGGYSDE